VLFICNLFLLSLYMWYFSNVFKYFPFLSTSTISIVSVILPYACPILNMWFECPVLMLFLMACMCSLYLVLNVWPVCPKYFSAQYSIILWTRYRSQKQTIHRGVLSQPLQGPLKGLKTGLSMQTVREHQKTQGLENKYSLARKKQVSHKIV
jgi:hypothetical protein